MRRGSARWFEGGQWVRRVLGVCLLAACASARAGDTLAEPAPETLPRDPIKLGVLVNQGKDACQAMWTPTATYLSEVLGQPVQLMPLPFEAVEQAARNRSVHLLVVNSGLYANLEKKGLARAVATQLETAGGDVPLPWFGSVIFRRADRSDIVHVSDLARKRLAAVNPDSFGGWAAALDYLRQNGFDPLARARVLFLDDHNAVVRAVMEGGADAGIVRAGHLEAMAARGEIDPSLFVSLWAKPLDPSRDHAPLSTTSPYPNWPCAVVTGTLDEATALEVGHALIRLTPDHPAARSAGLAGWTIPLNYAPVWEALRRAGLVQPPPLGPGDFARWFRNHPMLLVFLVVFSGLLCWLTYRVARISGDLRIQSAERIRITRDLEAANARLQAILQGGSAVLWETDIHIHFTWFSSNTLDGRVFDITAGLHPMEIVHPEDMESIRDHLRQCVLEHVPFQDVECRLRDRDGRWLWVAISGEPFYNERGDFLGFRGITRSIHRRKLLDQAARSYEQEMIQWFREGPDGFLILCPPDGAIEEVNPRLEELLGFRRDELIGRSLRELNVWPEPAAVADMWRRVQAGETVHRVIPHRRKDGRIIQCAVSARLTNRQDNTRILAVLRDITEQVAARQVELAWSDRMRRLTAAAPGIAYEFRKNPDGTYCLPFSSDRMYEFFCIPHETLARDARPIFNRVHPDDLPEFMLSIQRSERAMIPWRHEFRLRLRDGNWLWFLGQSIPSPDPDGGITWRGFLLDVTESRRLGHALRERERFLANLLESLPVGVAVVRRDDGRVVLLNPALAALLGRDPKPVVGMSCAALLCGGRATDCPLHGTDAAANEQSALHLTRSDGGQVSVLRTFRLHETPDGEQYLLMAFTDISEREKLENALRDSEYRYRQLADAIPALVWISGPDGARVDFNQTWLTFRGRTLEDERGDGWIEGVHPDDRARVVKTWREALAVREAFTMTYRLARHDGVYRWIEDHGVPRFDASGQFLGYAGGCVDVTARQEAADYLETVMACVQAGIFISDAGSGLLLDANREAERLTERPRGELVGQPWRNLLVPEKDATPPLGTDDAWDARIHTPLHHRRVVRVRETTGNVGERALLVQSLMDITDLRRLLESQDIDIALARRLLDAVARPQRRHVDLGNDLSLFVESRVWPCQKAGGDHALVRVRHDITGGSLTSLALCDQSGHEVNCVLRGVYTTLILDNLLRGPRHALDERLERLNALLEQSGVFRDTEFVTGWFADIDHEVAILTCAACGHPPAFLVRDGQVRLLPEPGASGLNSPLAILPEPPFTAAAERLKPGDRLIACTDGLLEMPQRNQRRRFTASMLARVLQAFVRDAPDASVSELADALVAAVSAFSGESVGGPDGRNSSADDVSLLLMELEPVHNTRQWTLHPRTVAEVAHSVDVIVRNLVPAWENLGLHSPEFRLRSILEESLTNIWEHGHHRNPDLPIRVRAWVRNDFVLELSGCGEGFEPERVPDPRLPDRLLAERGRGLFMMRRAADSIEWLHEGRTLRAALHRPPSTRIRQSKFENVLDILNK